MPRIHFRRLATAGLLSIVAVAPAAAIEMFTYFGDGSQIGLPRLEVPVQAYPGIPLRSDRLRARSRAQQARRSATSNAAPRGSVDAAAVPGADGHPGIPGGGITIRPMPRAGYGAPGAGTPVPVNDGRTVTRTDAPAPRAGGSPSAPEAVPRPPEAPLPGLSRPVFPPRP